MSVQKEAAKTPETFAFQLPVRVYFEDTDAGGIVYHARYLYFLERARTEWLRNLGFNQSELQAQNTVFVIRDMQIKWQSPARLDDELLVSVRVDKIKKASMVMSQIIISGEIKNVSATVTIACLQSDTMKPMAIPREIVDEAYKTSIKE
jgi:acyl-CoA thioester hydrolase